MYGHDRFERRLNHAVKPRREREHDGFIRFSKGVRTRNEEYLTIIIVIAKTKPLIYRDIIDSGGACDPADSRTVRRPYMCSASA
jgi:hypothetical protein